MNWDNLPLKNGSIGEITISDGRLFGWENNDIVLLDTESYSINYEYRTQTKYNLLISAEDSSGVSGIAMFKTNDTWSILQVLHGFVLFGGDKLQRSLLMLQFLYHAFGAIWATRFSPPDQMEAFYAAPSYWWDEISHAISGNYTNSYGRIYQTGFSVAYATDYGNNYDKKYSTYVTIRPEQGDGSSNLVEPGIICVVVFRDRISNTWYVSVPIFKDGATYNLKYKVKNFPERKYSSYGIVDWNGTQSTVSYNVMCLILNYNDGKLTTRLGAPTISILYEDDVTKKTSVSLLYANKYGTYIDDDGRERIPTNYINTFNNISDAESVKPDGVYDYRVIKKDYNYYKNGDHFEVRQEFSVWVQNQIKLIPYLDYEATPPEILDNLELKPYYNPTFEPLLNSRDASAISSSIQYAHIYGWYDYAENASSSASPGTPPIPNLDDYETNVVNNPNLIYETEIHPISKPWFLDRDVNVFYFTDSQKAVDFVSFMESL